MNEKLENQTTVAFTQRGMVVFSLILGLVFAIVIILGVFALSEFKKQSRINTVNIHQLQDVNKQLKFILKPTPAQYRKQLKEGIKRCLAEPSCRKLFPKVVKTPAARHQAAVDRVRRSNQALTTIRAGVGSDRPSDQTAVGVPAPTQHHSPRPTRQGGGVGAPPSSPSSPPSGAPAPAPTSSPQPSPLVNVQLTPFPTVCTPLIGFNC